MTGDLNTCPDCGNRVRPGDTCWICRRPKSLRPPARTADTVNTTTNTSEDNHG